MYMDPDPLFTGTTHIASMFNFSIKTALHMHLGPVFADLFSHTELDLHKSEIRTLTRLKKNLQEN